MSRDSRRTALKVLCLPLFVGAARGLAFSVPPHQQAAHDARVPNGQDRWRWCRKCQGLWFSGNPTKGACPVGGDHEASGSSNYVLAQTPAGQNGQDNWRWCRKCEGLWFAGNETAGVCPAGGGHTRDGSSSYVLSSQ